MSKYAALDTAIVAAIEEGYCDFTRIVTQVADLARSLATVDYWGNQHRYRVVDRRLQSMRKAGKLSYSPGNGWSVV